MMVAMRTACFLGYDAVWSGSRLYLEGGGSGIRWRLYCTNLHGVTTQNTAIF